MTKLNDKPLVRSIPGFVVTLTGRTVTIRPQRSRKPEASVTLAWDAIYRRGLLARVTPSKKPKRRVSRGLLGLGASK